MSDRPDPTDDETDAMLRRERPLLGDDGEDLDGMLHHAALRQKLAGAGAQPVPFRQWDVERRIGRGGMAAVYLAKNRKLGRHVALKVIRRIVERESVEQAERLVREARALAQIRHRNVVQVYQIDTSSGLPVIEMEYIDGPTFQEWKDDTRPSWRAIVTAYCAAGDGLAALHEAKITHRDVKPANILLDRDGTVKLADLGLAVAFPRFADLRAPALELDDAGTDERLTASGGLVGTYGFIAPEVLGGHEADTASDQFGFAASLFESLFGELPFVGDDPTALARAMLESRPRVPEDAPRVPRWLLRCLQQALRFDPEERFPSVAALVSALRRGMRRRTIGLVGIAAVIGLSGLSALGSLLTAAPENPCATAGAEFLEERDKVRNDALRARVAEQGDAAARSYDVFSTVLTDRSRRWADTSARLCAADQRAQTTEGAQREADRELNARQHACLEHSRRHLAALVASLVSARDELSRQLVDTTSAIESLPSCDDRDSLRNWPLSSRDDVRDAKLADALARAFALESAGRYADAEELARHVSEQSSASHPLRNAEALYQLGHALGLQGRYPEAFARLDDARNAAFAVGHDELWCRAAAYQAKLAANNRLDARASERELGAAEACIQRIDAHSPRLRADLLEARGLLASAAGDPRGAVHWHHEALEVRSSHLGEHHFEVTKSLHNLANALAESGAADEARERFEQALALREDLRGPNHVDVADVLFDLGSFLRGEGMLEKSSAYLRRALAIYENARSREHSVVARVHLELALIEIEKGELSKAKVHLASARNEQRAAPTLDATHLDRVSLLHVEGLIALREQDFEVAHRAYARATMLLRQRDATSPQIHDSLLKEIEALYGLADYQTIALYAVEEGDSLVTSVQALDATVRGQSAWYIADSLLREEHWLVSIEYFEIALAAYETRENTAYVAELQWQLARLLREHTARRKEAHLLAVAARAAYRELDEDTANRISHWIEHNVATN